MLLNHVCVNIYIRSIKTISGVLHMFFKKKKPYYEENITIGSNDVDSEFNLKMSGFFKIVQDVIMNDTNRYNVGSKDLKEKGLIWVITRVKVEVNRMPKFCEEVKCITYPGKTLKMLYPRYFRVLDKDGNVLINLSSIWAILDEKTRKPLLNSPLEGNYYEYSMPDELPLPSKISSPEVTVADTRKIHYSDCDLNKHLNNTRYIEILQDIKTSDFYENHKIKAMTINYLKELKEGEVIDVCTSNSFPEYIEVKKSDTVYFLACVEYK